jgi:hypothetical protein
MPGKVEAVLPDTPVANVTRDATTVESHTSLANVTEQTGGKNWRRLETSWN